LNAVARFRPLRVLVLYWHPVGTPIRAAIYHHLHALDHGTRQHDVWYVNTFSALPRWLRYMPVDGVILHTTLLCLRWSEFFVGIRRDLLWLSDLSCPKIALPQDEYDHSELLNEWLLELGVSDVFSVFEGPDRDLLYQRLTGHAAFHKCFTGYIDEATASEVSKRLVPISARPLDIVYRASHLPYWFGRQGQLKDRIGTVVLERALERGLRTDISTRAEDTILGERWFDFLMSGRTVLGCESGSSVLDRRGEMQVRIHRMLARKPEMAFEEVSQQMPTGWDGHAFFALSPRHFESVITKTCQVLIEGEYEGVFKRERHYIPMRRDLSNVDEVLDRVEDRRLTQEIADTAYEEIYLSGKYGYAALATDIENVLCRARTGERRPKGVRVRTLGRVAGGMLAERDRVAQPQRGVSPAPPSGRGVRGARFMTRLRVASRIVVAKRLLTTSLWRQRSSIKILFAWFMSREVRRAAGLSQFILDLVTLELVRDAVNGQGDHEFRVVVSYDADRGEFKFESRRRGGEGAGRPGGVSGAAVPRGLLRSIVWDHGAMGPWVSPSPGRPGIGTWLGPDGQYRFDALLRLASSHDQLVWQALLPVGRRSRQARGHS
jgi:hypothetical protein